MRLEEISAPARLTGIVPGRPVTVLAAWMHGANAVEVTYRDDTGALGQVVLFRGDEARVARHQSTGRPFDADPDDFRLAAEAQRMVLAPMQDPMLAIATSNVRPLPHQIRAVYGEMLPRTPLRFLLADDPGAGKTIMAGLYIKELILREDVRTCLIVAPGSLVEQWQDELGSKFGLEFEILAGAEDVVPGRSVFERRPLLIARMDQVARNPALLAEVERADLDLVVVDEAHRMSASWFGEELTISKRFALGQLLSERTRHLLLMTATPHNGKDEDFQTFLSLLDADRFAGLGDKRTPTGAADGLMRRMVKEKLLTLEGRPLFPQRIAETVSYRLSDDEQHLYDEVTEYVRNGMNLADRLDGKRRSTVGFALTVLQRRLASSPEAIHRSLQRRAERLDRVRRDLLAGVEPAAPNHFDAPMSDEVAIGDEFDAARIETEESELADAATSSQTARELDTEIADLLRLEGIAHGVLQSRQDVKWRELRAVIERQVLTTESGTPRKLIVFSEHRDTLHYLERRIADLIQRPGCVVTIHGGLSRPERKRITEAFTTDPGVQILVATDAAGEGLNLQAAHLMVNYDLPWNPNRIEQRFGRIHRIGQTEVCRLWNLVAEGTREGEVYLLLLKKIAEQRAAYDGEIFNVLGTSLGNLELSQLLREAIQYGEEPTVRARMQQVIDDGISAGLRELLHEAALASEALVPEDLAEIRAGVRRANESRVSARDLREAFIDGFQRAGGTVETRGTESPIALNVPPSIRAGSAGAPIARRYSHVAFDVANIGGGAVQVDLVAPGHPLFDATMRRTLERYGPLLDRGATFTSSALSDPALLMGVLDEVRDATGATVAKQFRYWFVDEFGVRDAGPSPFRELVAASSSSGAPPSWVATREREGLSWIVEHELLRTTARVIDQRRVEYERIRTRVVDRLSREIERLARAATDADANASSGRQVRVSGETLRRRAEELAQRRVRRLSLLDLQLTMSPIAPRLTAVALVLPS